MPGGNFSPPAVREFRGRGLLVLNSFMTLPDNLSLAFSGTAPGDAPACGATLAVASAGMIGGMVVRGITAPLGLAWEFGGAASVSMGLDGQASWHKIFFVG